MGCKILKRVIWPWPRPFQGRFFFGRVTCYGKLMYQIRSLWVHPLRSYEWQCKMQKMGWFGLVRGHSRSTAMSPFDRAHTTSCSTLIETMCLSFTFFRDIAGYLSKFADFDHPTCIRRPCRGWPRSNLADIFGIRKLESLGYRVVLFVWYYVLPF